MVMDHMNNRDTTFSTVAFGDPFAMSRAFQALFDEGMALVEEAAAFLDGPGREQSRFLPRIVALTYSTESMRLTTRLMQIASWLLVYRAVSCGEMTMEEAASTAAVIGKFGVGTILDYGVEGKESELDFDKAVPEFMYSNNYVHLKESERVILVEHLA